METTDSTASDSEASMQEYERVLRVGTQHVNVSAVANKVLEDIRFLRDRIALIRQQRNPNPVMLSTFEKMLESRKAVLHWLQEQSPAQTAQIEARHRVQSHAG